MTNEKLGLLKEKLKSILNEVSHRSDVKQRIGEEFISRNLSSYRAMNVFMGIESLDVMTTSEKDARFLFIFSQILGAYVEDADLDLRNYFTELECKMWANYRAEREPENIFPLVFENATQLADNIWQTTISAQKLYKLDSNNVFVYNFLTQRQPKITSAGVQIDFDKKKALEIKERILERKQFPDHIMLNILNTFQEEIHYDEKKLLLTVGENSIINTFDGHHRKVANSLAMMEDPDVDFTWGLIITNMSESEARDYMLQINKQKPIKKSQIKTWDMDKKENLVVKVISDDKISRLNKVMVEQRVEVRRNKGLTTRNVIAEAIADNYKIDETTDIRALGKWIVEFTDEIARLNPEAFIANPYKIRELSAINDENIFYGYIALSAKLKNDPDWKRKLQSKMGEIDFSWDNKAWQTIGLTRKREANKALREKLYKLFTKAV